IKEAKTFIAEPVDSRTLYFDPTTGTEKPVVDEDLEDEQELNSQIPETPLEPSPQSLPQPTTKSITQSTAIYFVLLFVLLLLVIIVALIYRRKR
ncbi:MAG: hypothetical protein LBK06_04345, partial [Planctomycetaceae bacterium]|nr:hypothetical protein [Planctomycetaceae bacterium]